MDITTTKSEEFYKIEIAGDLDATSSVKLDAVIAEALQNEEKFILVDCAKLDYISSAGLGVFMSYIQDFKDTSTYFALYNLSDKVRNVFNILGLEKLVQIFNNETDAKAATHTS